MSSVASVLPLSITTIRFAHNSLPTVRAIFGASLQVMIRGVIWSSTWVLLRRFQFAIERFHPRSDRLPAVALADVAAAGLSHRRRFGGIFRQPVDGRAERSRVTAGDKPAAGF